VEDEIRLLVKVQQVAIQPVIRLFFTPSSVAFTDE